MATMLSDAELLAKLVAFDSTSRNSNLPIAEFICSYFDHSDFEITRNENNDGSKVNLIMQLPGSVLVDGNERSGLVLSGHMDVVPADEPGWNSDPFTLTETDNAYVARGACDMKGFVALAMNTMRRAADWLLLHPLVLLFTFDEELGTLGAQHFVNTWDHPFELPRSAIIGEPTSLRVVRMHKGHLKMRVTISGVGAHSGYPHLGVNAIEPAGRVISALSMLRQQWKEERTETSEFFPETPYVALNIAQIRGGSAINIVPDHCEIDFGVRVLPGMDSANLIEQIRSTLKDAGELGKYSVEVIDESQPLLTDENTLIHQTVCELISQSQSHGVSYASDAGPFSKLDMDCILIGPGTIEVAHKPNESVPKHEFLHARKLLERIVHKMCCIE